MQSGTNAVTAEGVMAIEVEVDVSVWVVVVLGAVPVVVVDVVDLRA